MGNRIRDYHRPEDPDAAQALLSRRDAHAVSLVISPHPHAEPFAGVDAVVDLSRLELNYIKEEEEALRIGAMTPLQEMVDSPLIKSLADGVLADEAQRTAHLGLRNLSTLGGVMRSNDGVPEVRLALLALNAMPVMQGGILTEVQIASQPNAHGAPARVARSPRDQAIVAACAVLEVNAGVCREVRLAVVCPKPKLIDSVDDMLKGKAFTPDLLQSAAEAVMKEIESLGDYRGSAQYRREMAGVLARRALETAWKRANI